MIEKAYFLLGGNMGDRLSILASARKLLSKCMTGAMDSSSVYETAAWGVEDQPSFLNQVVGGYTSLPAHELLVQIHQIELLLGRERHDRWHARTIDIDILFYGDHCIEADNLTVPHKEIANRRFTLVPMVELAPDYIHPRLQKSMAYLLHNCHDELPVNKYGSMPPHGNGTPAQLSRVLEKMPDLHS